MDDGLRFGPIVNCQMKCGLAGGLLFFFEWLPFPVNLDQVLRIEKAQRGVLPGNEEPLLPDPAAYVPSPAADEPALKEKLSPMDYLTL